MKKIHKIIIIILAVVLVVAVVVSGYRYNVISKAKTGYLVFADKSVVVIDLKETTKTEYNVEGYSELCNVGKYYDGDFCCVAVNNQTKQQEILLFKNGVVEKSYPAAEKIMSISAYNDKLYYLTEENELTGNLICLYNNKIEIIESNVEDFAVNSLGGVAYIKEIPDEEYSAESDNDGILYYYFNGTITKLGDAYKAMWLSDNELLVSREKVEKNYDENGELISAAHTYEDYVVSIENNEWIYSKEFNKISAVIIDVSPDGKNAITRIIDEGYIEWSFGIYDIEKDIFSKKAIYDGVNNKDVFENVGANFIWLNENPMD